MNKKSAFLVLILMVIASRALLVASFETSSVGSVESNKTITVTAQKHLDKDPKKVIAKLEVSRDITVEKLAELIGKVMWSSSTSQEKSDTFWCPKLLLPNGKSIDTDKSLADLTQEDQILLSVLIVMYSTNGEKADPATCDEGITYKILYPVPTTPSTESIEVLSPTPSTSIPAQSDPHEQSVLPTSPSVLPENAPLNITSLDQSAEVLLTPAQIKNPPQPKPVSSNTNTPVKPLNSTPLASTSIHNASNGKPVVSNQDNNDTRFQTKWLYYGAAVLALASMGGYSLYNYFYNAGDNLKKDEKAVQE